VVLSRLAWLHPFSSRRDRDHCERESQHVDLNAHVVQAGGADRTFAATMGTDRMACLRLGVFGDTRDEARGESAHQPLVDVRWLTQAEKETQK
ncbi:MAG TPA: hypothetical protein PJ992_08095, partial [Arachnia sp.]|nr:hypothetical protein [Arachnia sp.]